MTAAKLKELEAKATDGPWCGRLLIEITEADSDLCDYLRNHAQDFIKLIEAAENVVAAETDPDGYVAKIGLREVLAAFKEKP